MYEMKKDSFMSYDVLNTYFPKNKKFSTAVLKLFADNYVIMKKDSGIYKINIEEKGLFAATSSLFKLKENNLIWTFIKDGGSIIINIIIASIAFAALKNDNSKYLRKDELKSIQQQIIRTQAQQYQNQLKTEKQIYQLNNQIDSLSRKTSFK